MSKVGAKTLDGKVRAIIAPHAGYIYSGQVAAHAFKTLKGDFRKIFIIAGVVFIFILTFYWRISEAIKTINPEGGNNYIVEEDTKKENF